MSADLIDHLFEITKEDLLRRIEVTHGHLQSEAMRLFSKYATRTSKRGWVYLISQEGGDDVGDSVFVKIGRTVKDPDVRLRTLQGQNPVKLKFLTYILTVDSYALERELHRKYKDYRTEEGGKEWFEFPNNIAPRFWHPEWYKYYLGYHVNPDWFSKNYFEQEHPDIEFFSMLRAQERSLRILRLLGYTIGHVRMALLKKGLLKESE